MSDQNNNPRISVTYCIVCDKKLLPNAQCNVLCLRRRMEVEYQVKQWLSDIREYGKIIT